MKEDGKLTSAFRNKADLSRGRSTPYKLKHALKTVDKKLEGRDMKMEDAMGFVANKRVAKATDWVIEFAPGCFLIYGCRADGCETYPLKSSYWYIFNNEEGEDGTFEGPKSFWACAVCLGRFKYGESGPFRLFSLPLPEAKEGFYLAYWGNHDESANAKLSQQMMILKGATLYEEMRGKKITFDTVLQAVDILAERAEIELAHRLGDRVSWVTSQPVGKFSTKLYCEDQRLSLPFAGKRFQVFSTKKDPEADLDDIPMLTTDRLQTILDTCAAFFDLSTYDAKGPSDRKMIWNITERVKNLKIVDEVLKTIASSSSDA